MALKWNAKDGTSGLKTHLQSCKRGKTDADVIRQLADCAGTTLLPTVRHVSITNKKDVTKAVVHFCARHQDV